MAECKTPKGMSQKSTARPDELVRALARLHASGLGRDFSIQIRMVLRVLAIGDRVHGRRHWQGCLADMQLCRVRSGAFYLAVHHHGSTVKDACFSSLVSPIAALSQHPPEKTDIPAISLIY